MVKVRKSPSCAFAVDAAAVHNFYYFFVSQSLARSPFAAFFVEDKVARRLVIRAEHLALPVNVTYDF